MKDINDTGLGEFISLSLKRNGWSLRNGALKIGVSAAYLSKLINHKADSNPKTATLDKLANGLRVNRRELYEAAGYFPLYDGESRDQTDDRIDHVNLWGQYQKDVVAANEKIPVYGQIHAGPPSFAEQNIIGNTPATKSIIDEYGRENLFALQIKGDSMSKVLPDGFIAVFCKECDPETGDIVAVLIDHEDATIKRFKETSMAVIFEPDSYNPSYSPIIFQKSGEQDFKILGKYLYATSMPI